LKATQLRTVADRRFGDAAALRETEENERANGVMYLGGFVIECLLKAKLLEKYRWLENSAPVANRSKADQHRWSLCYRQHDLAAILEQLPEVISTLRGAEVQGKTSLLQSLRAICANWTIFARYSPMSAMMDEATDFLDRVEELKRCLQ
jgi:hypothetical protein